MSTTAKPRGQVLRMLRTLHGWLGIFVLPWVVVIGASGFYLNHSRTILPWLEGGDYEESRFDEWPAAEPVPLATAQAVAARYWPDEPVPAAEEVNYHDRPAYQFRKHSGLVIVTRPTGHYFVKTRYTRRTFAPDGTLLHSKFYWGVFFKRLHETGWVDFSLGTWLADITSLAMVVFGLSGGVLWLAPRFRRLRRAIAGG